MCVYVAAPESVMALKLSSITICHVTVMSINHRIINFLCEDLYEFVTLSLFVGRGRLCVCVFVFVFV